MERVLENGEPDNQCFGCSPHNERGLQLEFVQLDDGTVQSRYEVADHHVGPPGIVHGGIQAVLLDEVMGITASAHLRSPADAATPEPENQQRRWAVTAELDLRYRGPVPVAQSLLIRGRLNRIDGRDLYISGEIIGPDERVLTTAEARFKVVGEGAEGR